MITWIALSVFFFVTVLKDLGVVFRYQDLVRAAAGSVVVISLIVTQGFGL